VICIRIFKTRQETVSAKKALQKGDVTATITEDKFNNIPIQEFGVDARFRLKVEDKDFYKAARFLANELRKIKRSNVS
jgi:hypothetical protein